MGGERKAFAKLLSLFESAIGEFPDLRTGSNTQYEIRDAALSAFSVFFTQSPSFLAHQRLMRQSKGSSNARTIFGIENIPSDNQVRNLLDPVSPQLCMPVFWGIHSWLSEEELLQREYRSLFGSYWMALDGTWFHSSEQIHCPKCLSKDHQDGRRNYYHSAITPVFVRPGNNQVISLQPEFISRQDGSEKQDCEINAAKRWLSGAGAKYAPMGITLLGDDIYCHQPFCEDAIARGYHFMLTCKSSSHKYLYEWIEEAELGVDIQEKVVKRWTGKERLIYRYRFMNDVPLRDGKDALRVNWCELVILDTQGKVRRRFAFATDHRIDRHNLVALVDHGRARWKIENEHNNTLKTQGYNLEHNFGHGNEHLSNLLLVLNLLAFLFHTVLHFFDKRYALVRKSLKRRQTFFDDLRALSRYICFDSWDELLRFMLRGLEIPDPGG